MATNGYWFCWWAFVTALLILLVVPACSALHQPAKRFVARTNRRSLIQTASAAAAVFLTPLALPAAQAFDGGVGGLGKTKPQLGITLRSGSAPVQNAQGIVSAEILSLAANPILIQFQTPYPLLQSSSGLEARDLQNPESAFVQVISGVTSSDVGNSKKLYKLLIDNIFSSSGKFGAYSSPIDVKIKPAATNDSSDNILYTATFTTYTPAMRESDRKVLLVTKLLGDNTLVVLVVGTTAARFSKQERTLQNIADSFLAVDAPKSELR